MNSASWGVNPATAVRAGAVALAFAILVTGCGTAARRAATAHSPAPVGSAPEAAPSIAAKVMVPRPVAKPSTPCTTNARRQYILVSLHRQHMWMCERHRVAKDTAITSGMLGADTRTPTGSFHIQGRNRNSVLTLNTGATYDVKYWIPFDAPLFGFHDSPWQQFPYGSPRYRTHGSHGCVHMPLAAIRFLYDWAHIGTVVRIKA